MLTDTYLTIPGLPLPERAILELVRQNPGMTRNEIEAALGVAKGSYRQKFPPLIKDGYLIPDRPRDGERAEVLSAAPLEMLD